MWHSRQSGVAGTPFHLLATEGIVHTGKPNTWHMETLARLCAADPAILFATPFRLVDLEDPASISTATAWWTELTATGGEGMVIKPLDFIATGSGESLNPP